ncbi:DUF1499 domain-containing protein [Granulosicoccus antarcticus]|uniref:DUF1499 domain-containing protein n=1 Tax=Granulosicoccus antarcticus IMCC3135 TaxID=1192854 RepID=A0A2Z2NTX1_9GAMM|nr:DUF1499 domain-containing protein [Granulosicoccus antarcticus]ASJ72210.1 hypothetical protein IMCC3135_10580 [Granulosicoccus antarcticus IMCC3135]
MKLLVILILLALLAIGVRLVAPRLGHSVAGGIVELEGRVSLADCPDTPNCHRDQFTISADPSLAISTLADIVSGQPGVKIITQGSDYLHATYSTRVMGFVDDVEFLLDTDGDAQTGSQPRVLVRSASRLGKSDLGANAKRVEALRRDSINRL